MSMDVLKLIGDYAALASALVVAFLGMKLKNERMSIRAEFDKALNDLANSIKGLRADLREMKVDQRLTRLETQNILTVNDIHALRGFLQVLSGVFPEKRSELEDCWERSEKRRKERIEDETRRLQLSDLTSKENDRRDRFDVSI